MTDTPLPKDPSDIELNLQSVLLDDDQSHRAMALAELVAHMPVTAARELVFLRAERDRLQNIMDTLELGS